MALNNQGFAIQTNLVESTQDRAVLNNIGVTPIADDLSLFYNNLRNTTVLFISNTEIDGELIIPSNTDVVFSDGTILTINDQQYTVYDSDGNTSFKLRDVSANTITNPPEGNYVRSDAVTPLNVQFLNSFNFLNPTASPNIGDFISDLEDLETRYFTQLFQISQGISIEKGKDDISFNAGDLFDLEGEIIISDPSDINNTAIQEDGPGLFIFDGENAVRAFSNNSNPWQQNVGASALETTAASVTIGNLIMENGLSLNEKGSKNMILKEQGNIADAFTHRQTVLIDGEVYSLCITEYDIPALSVLDRLFSPVLDYDDEFILVRDVV